MGVVDLTHIELATEEDKSYDIDHWAHLFKATTWEELKMIAEKNEFMQEASQAIYELSADEMIRQRCRAREEYNRLERTRERNEAMWKAELDKTKGELQDTQAKLDDAQSKLDEAQKLIAQLLAEKTVLPKDTN